MPLGAVRLQSGREHRAGFGGRQNPRKDAAANLRLRIQRNRVTLGAAAAQQFSVFDRKGRRARERAKYQRPERDGFAFFMSFDRTTQGLERARGVEVPNLCRSRLAFALLLARVPVDEESLITVIRPGYTCDPLGAHGLKSRVTPGDDGEVILAHNRMPGTAGRILDHVAS
jgi:hypothetical protein